MTSGSAVSGSALCLALALLVAGCSPAASDGSAQPELEPDGAYTLRSERHLLHELDPRPKLGSVFALIEIPSGSNGKWEVGKDDGHLHLERRGGAPRVVDYLAYPANYGMIPQTLLPKQLGGDGDPLDVLVLGPAAARGALLRVELIGVLRLLDGGEQDDKLLAVQPGAPLGEIRELAELDQRYPGVRQIVELWFTNYKGPGVMEPQGFGDRETAIRILNAALREYRESRKG